MRLGGVLERQGGGLAGRNHLRYLVEVAGPHLALVAGGGVALHLGSELRLLQLGVSGHAALAVAAGEVEHAEVERVEAGQGDELELVAHLAELDLKARDLVGAELLLPVERWRAVVGQELARKLGVDAFGEATRLHEVGRGSFAPYDVGVRRVGDGARDGAIDAALQDEEPFAGALGGDEGTVALVDVGGEKLGALSIGAVDE